MTGPQKPQRDMAGMLIEVVCTGDKRLTGRIANTNFSHMTQKLADVGLPGRYAAGAAKRG